MLSSCSLVDKIDDSANETEAAILFNGEKYVRDTNASWEPFGQLGDEQCNAECISYYADGSSKTYQTKIRTYSGDENNLFIYGLESEFFDGCVFHKASDIYPQYGTETVSVLKLICNDDMAFTKTEVTLEGAVKDEMVSFIVKIYSKNTAPVQYDGIKNDYYMQAYFNDYPAAKGDLRILRLKNDIGLYITFNASDDNKEYLGGVNKCVRLPDALCESIVAQLDN